MKIILLLIVVSLIVAAGFLFAFFWAVKNGQYEDDFTPAMRILVEDDMLLPVATSSTSQSKATTSQNKES